MDVSAVVGANVKLMWQLAPGASDVPWQSCVLLNGADSVPPDRVTTFVADEMFVIVVVWAGDVDPVNT